MQSCTFYLSAAVPPEDFPQQRFHYVFVPVSGTVLTELTCDILPGAARKSYNIEWFRINPSGGFNRITEGINQNFNLTLPVDINSNGRVYMCTVHIDHDGDGKHPTPHDGAKITLRAEGKLEYALHLRVTIDHDGK